MNLALKRLPWYVAAWVVFGPLLIAPFTSGASLFWYGAYFLAPDNVMTWLPAFAGMFFWLLRVFTGYFIQSWLDDHNVRWPHRSL